MQTRAASKVVNIAASQMMINNILEVLSLPASIDLMTFQKERASACKAEALTLANKKLQREVKYPSEVVKGKIPFNFISYKNWRLIWKTI